MTTEYKDCIVLAEVDDIYKRCHLIAGVAPQDQITDIAAEQGWKVLGYTGAIELDFASGAYLFRYDGTIHTRPYTEAQRLKRGDLYPPDLLRKLALETLEKLDE